MTKFTLTPSTFLWSMALLTGALSAFPRQATDCNLDYWSVPPLLREMYELRRDDQQIDQRYQEVRSRWARREQIVNGILRSQVSLRDAVAELAPLYRTAPGQACRDRMFPGRCEEERVARHVIYLVKMESQERNTDCTALTVRLETELQVMLGDRQEAQ